MDELEAGVNGPASGEAAASPAPSSVPSVGGAVTWLHEPRGGYGYVIPVAAVVKKVTAKRVQIEVNQRQGAAWVPVLRWVKSDKVRA